jgi:hypothetical protein
VVGKWFFVEGVAFVSCVEGCGWENLLSPALSSLEGRRGGIVAGFNTRFVDLAVCWI